MNKAKLLIVDDEPNMCTMLAAMVARHGYQVQSCADGEAALSLIASEQFDFILCDVKMPKLDGLGFLEQGREHLGETTVIMMSAYGTIDLALEAMRAGAYDFISKPFKSDEVLLALKKAAERERLRRENAELKRRLQTLQTATGFGAMIGASRAIKALFARAERLAPYDATVLITGESGTGKELVARGLHDLSPRSDQPFIAVNCGAIPDQLLESELFGNVKGAFTGADTARAGLFEAAHGGTLLLDEIGELPLTMQVALLRVLQEREVRRLGATRTTSVDVRVVAATAVDLSEAVAAGSFREDLYYRVNVLNLRVPPLRERREDIPLLCHHFVKKFNNQFGRSINGFTPAALKLLSGYQWPGNVRELENVIQHAVLMAPHETIEVADLPTGLGISAEGADSALSLALGLDTLSVKAARALVEAQLIRLALAECGGNKSRAADLLELSYPSLLAKIKEYGIDRDDGKAL